MPSQIPESGEFELAEAALNRPLPSLPAMDTDFLAGAVAARTPVDEVRSYARSVFMRVGAGPLNECRAFEEALGRRADRCRRRISALSQDQIGRRELVAEDSRKAINWNPAVVMRVTWPLLAWVMLSVAGLVALMSTLEAAADTYKVFDDWLTRLTFAGLPVIGIPAGYKIVGHLRPNPLARRRYWMFVSGLGVTLALIWIPLVGFVLGSEAWDVGGDGGDDLPTGAGGGAGIGLGGVMTSVGLCAEGLLASCCWNKFETTLESLCDFEMAPDKVCSESNNLIGTLSRDETTARTLIARFKDRSEAIEQSCQAYEDAYVAALAPRWSPPPGGEGETHGGTRSPRRPDAPDFNINRNGSDIPKEREDR